MLAFQPRLDFDLVLFISLFEKMAWKLAAGKISREKYLAGKRTSKEKTGGEKNQQKRIGGEKTGVEKTGRGKDLPPYKQQR